MVHAPPGVQVARPTLQPRKQPVHLRRDAAVSSRRDQKATQTQRMQDAVLWVHVTSRWMAAPLQSVEGGCYSWQTMQRLLSAWQSQRRHALTHLAAVRRVHLSRGTLSKRRKVYCWGAVHRLLLRRTRASAAYRRGSCAATKPGSPLATASCGRKRRFAFHSAHVRVKTDRRKVFHSFPQCAAMPQAGGAGALNIRPDPG